MPLFGFVLPDENIFHRSLSAFANKISQMISFIKWCNNNNVIQTVTWNKREAINKVIEFIREKSVSSDTFCRRTYNANGVIENAIIIIRWTDHKLFWSIFEMSDSICIESCFKSIYCGCSMCIRRSFPSLINLFTENDPVASKETDFMWKSIRQEVDAWQQDETTSLFIYISMRWVIFLETIFFFFTWLCTHRCSIFVKKTLANMFQFWKPFISVKRWRFIRKSNLRIIHRKWQQHYILFNILYLVVS